MKNSIKKIAKWLAITLAVIIVPIALYLSPFFLFSPEAGTSAENITTVKELDSYLSALSAEGYPPAMDVTVLKHGQPVFSKAYGIVNGITGEKATKDHVYHYWSMTKSFTSVAIFQLLEQGRISLDESVTTYLPNFNPIDELGKPVKVTIEHLLSHTSGLPDFDKKMAVWLHGIDEPRFGETRMVNERFQGYQTLKATPGTVSKYGNINFILLGAVIESVTQGTYEDYIRQAILVPLNMKRTDFIYRPDMSDKIAMGTIHKNHFWRILLTFFGPEGGLDSITDKKIGDRHWLKLVYTDYAAATALIGTGDDMARFGQMLLNHGELDDVRILSAENTKKILFGGRFADEKEQVAAGNIELALGYGIKTWYRDGVELIGHGGGGAGYALQYFVVPEKDLVVVMLTNQTLNSQIEISKKIVSLF